MPPMFELSELFELGLSLGCGAAVRLERNMGSFTPREVIPARRSGLVSLAGVKIDLIFDSRLEWPANRAWRDNDSGLGDPGTVASRDIFSAH
mmetsp:Transcript_1163/g.2115  ORF Transcript_1163/g.2115 Transcript_1163/m.2115 type:complete len:92 (-) Transcript_1163:117-392(-)